jgi:hypothetical protein
MKAGMRESVAALSVVAALAAFAPAPFARVTLIPLESEFGAEAIIRGTETGLEFLSLKAGLFSTP